MIPEYEKLTLAFLEKHPANAARVLETVGVDSIVEFFSETPVRIIAPVLQYMTPQTAAVCFIALPKEKQSLILQDMGAHASVSILRHIAPEQRDPILAALPTRLSVRIRMQLRYTQGTVGSLMDTNIFVANKDEIAKDVLKSIRKQKESDDTVVYITDSAQHLKGYVDIVTLLRCTPETKMQRIMKPADYSLAARANLGPTINYPGWNSRHSLPVVDKDNKIVGRISYSDLANRPVVADTNERRTFDFLLMNTLHVYWRGWISILNLVFEKRI
jgi:magnesium transporter